MKKIQKSAFIALIIYVVILCWLVLFKFSLSTYEIPQMRSINLIPFMESKNWDGSLHLKELLANILIFIPFGTLMKRLKPTINTLQIAVSGFGFSLLLEVLQYVLGTGASDVTGLITNTVGALIGVFTYQGVKSVLSNKHLGYVDILVICFGISFMVMLLYLRTKGVFIWHYF